MRTNGKFLTANGIPAHFYALGIFMKDVISCPYLPNNGVFHEDGNHLKTTSLGSNLKIIDKGVQNFQCIYQNIMLITSSLDIVHN